MDDAVTGAVDGPMAAIAAARTAIREDGGDESLRKNLNEDQIAQLDPLLRTAYYQTGAVLAERNALEAELLRLNGPVCPFDQKRASEHGFTTSARRYICLPRQVEYHAAVREIEAWLRENAR